MTIHEPGWYPDPSDPSLQRYFNGTEWTNLPAPPPIDATPQTVTAPESAPVFEGDSRTVLCWAIVVGGALLSIGTLLAWMTASAGVINVSRNAFQMGAHESVTVDGPIVLVLGLIILGIGIARLTNSSMPRLVQRSPVIAGLGAAVILGYDYHAIQQWAQSLNSTFALGSVGTGFWVCCVGDLLAIGAGIGLRRQGKAVEAAVA